MKTSKWKTAHKKQKKNVVEKPVLCACVLPLYDFCFVSHSVPSVLWKNWYRCDREREPV